MRQEDKTAPVRKKGASQYLVFTFPFAILRVADARGKETVSEDVNLWIVFLCEVNILFMDKQNSTALYEAGTGKKHNIRGIQSLLNIRN